MSKISDVLNALDRDGFYSALRTLDKVEGFDRETRLLAVAYARRVQHLMVDPAGSAQQAVNAAADGDAEREWQEAELRRVCECIEAGTDPYPRGEA